MRHFKRRLSVLALALALSASNAVVCAGWMAAPEARMACCADGECPMHKSGSSKAASARELSQAEADSCCAVSEQDNRAPSPASAFVLAVGLAIAPIQSPIEVPAAPVRPDGRPAPVRTPGIPVATYLLLSVFVV
ncbi:MAG: hypothetical protein WBD07_01170 [Vicinamibacterales bacterium]